MQAHYLQHVPFEGLGSIASWLHHAGYDISCTRLYNAEKLPSLENIGLLIVMGGPMSVNDELGHPWLAAEKRFIRDAILAGIPVLGICLGAQLIASALGAEVKPNPQKEIGWFSIEAVTTELSSLFQFPHTALVFHWHGETFNLPDGAVRLAKSKACSNQAFQIGDNVIGLQFHLETTPTSALAIIENCKDELVDGEYIQSETEMLSAPQTLYTSINSLMEEVLDHLNKE